MTFQNHRHGVLLAALCAGTIASPAASAQSPWRPDKAVEIVVPTGAGGINDLNARLIQKTLQDQKLVSVPVLVQNKAGGNQSLAVVYVNQHAADPHYLMYATA